MGFEFLFIEQEQVFVLRIRFDLPSSINFTDINGIPKLGSRTFIISHPRRPKVVPLDSTGVIFYQSLIVSDAVSCIVSEI